MAVHEQQRVQVQGEQGVPFTGVSFFLFFFNLISSKRSGVMGLTRVRTVRL